MLVLLQAVRRLAIERDKSVGYSFYRDRRRDSEHLSASVDAWRLVPRLSSSRSAASASPELRQPCGGA